MELGYIEKIKDLTDRREKSEIIKNACSEIKFTRKSAGQYCISLMLGIILGGIVGFSNNTVENIRSIVSDANNILLVLVAMVFGSYSIFQALMSKDLVALLIKADGNLLKDSNKTFVQLTILYTMGIISNFVLMIVLKIIPNDFMLFNSVLTCNIFAGILIAVYLFFHVLLFLEVMNFAINLYRMFGVYNTLKALDSMQDE